MNIGRYLSGEDLSVGTVRVDYQKQIQQLIRRRESLCDARSAASFEISEIDRRLKELSKGNGAK